MRSLVWKNAAVGGLAFLATSAFISCSSGGANWLRNAPHGLDIKFYEEAEYEQIPHLVDKRYRREAIELLHKVDYRIIGNDLEWLLPAEYKKEKGPQYLLRGVSCDAPGGIQVYQIEGKTLVAFSGMGEGRITRKTPVVTNLRQAPTELYVTAITDL